MKKNKKSHKVSIIMGSQSDYSTMQNCEKVFKILKIKFEKGLFPHIELQKECLNMQKLLKKIIYL